MKGFYLPKVISEFSIKTQNYHNKKQISTMGCRHSTAKEPEQVVEQQVAENTPATTEEVVTAVETPAATEAASVETEVAEKKEEVEAPAAASEEPHAEPQAEEVEPIKGKYTVNGVSITEDGVVYYHVESADEKLALKKRYNDFKALRSKLGVKDLPALPPANLFTFLGGKHSQKLMKDREYKFQTLLNAIVAHPEASKSEAFHAFLA
jgi:hypothetical protein